MERTIFLQHYRVCVGADGTPNELGRDGAVIAYEAVDERTGEAVVVTLVPTESIAPALRERFEEQARAIERLRHANIAKVFDFGREGGNYVYVSERLPGETLALWVTQHGPMPADATLRVAEQVVSVLSSSDFHKLPYPPVEPAYIFVVPGQTPEGGWPLVKLTNFGLAGLSSEGETPPTVESPVPSVVAKLESNEPTLQQAPSARPESGEPTGQHRATALDSQIYALGGIMYFLLTGVALSAEAVRHPPKFSGFPKPLRNLLAQVLHPNPDKRPKDLVVLGEMVRSCLLKIERRLQLADRYGVPFKTTVPRPTQARPRRLLRTALAFGALVLAAAIVAAVLFPKSIGTILRRPGESKTIGVLVGVPESSPTPAAVQTASTPVPPVTVLSQAANGALALTNQPAPDGSAVPNSSEASSAGSEQTPSTRSQQQTQIATAQAQPPATQNDLAAASPNVSPDAQVAGEAATRSGEDSSTAQTTANAQSDSHSKKKRTASTSSPRQGSVRVRMVGITSDGRLIYRLPSGRTRIVTPDSEDNQFGPRRHRRTAIQRGEIVAPPSQFGPNYFPDY